MTTIIEIPDENKMPTIIEIPDENKSFYISGVPDTNIKIYIKNTYSGHWINMDNRYIFIPNSSAGSFIKSKDKIIYKPKYDINYKKYVYYPLCCQSDNKIRNEVYVPKSFIKKSWYHVPGKNKYIVLCSESPEIYNK